MVALLRPVPGNDVFDCGSQEMAIMWQSTGGSQRLCPGHVGRVPKNHLRRKWRAIIEGIQRPMFRKLDLCLKCLDLFPPPKDGLFLLWEVDAHISGGGENFA
jgi:hypothetical protein